MRPMLHMAMEDNPRGQVRVYTEDGELVMGTTCAGYLAEYAEAIRDEILTSEEEIRALGEGSIVIDVHDTAWTKFDSGEGDDWKTGYNRWADSSWLAHGPVRVVLRKK